MPSLTTEAIVLRRTDYRENDRMLTLLSPTDGRIDALARGCKRAKSPLVACAEQFAMGEYVLYTGKGHATVTGAQMHETFYPLREDYDRLRFATYLVMLAEAAAQPALPAQGMFMLLARSLSRLAYTARDARAITAAYLLHFFSVNGFSPELTHCVRCGKEIQDAPRHLFSLEEGGVLCRACSRTFTTGAALFHEQLQWLHDVLARGIDKTTLPDTDAPLELLESFADLRMEKRFMRGKAPR